MLSRELIVVLARTGRIEVIRTLKSYPDTDFTVNELARAAKVPTMTAWRAVKDLKRVGLVKTRRLGNALGVSITDDRERLRILRLIPETDPQRTAAKLYASALAELPWVSECRLFGNIGRGEHAPGDEVDIAVVYDDGAVQEDAARKETAAVADRIKAETNVTIVPLCVPQKDMSRRGGLASELRDKESIWKRKA